MSGSTQLLDGVEADQFQVHVGDYLGLNPFASFGYTPRPCLRAEVYEVHVVVAGDEHLLVFRIANDLGR